MAFQLTPLRIPSLTTDYSAENSAVSGLAQTLGNLPGEWRKQAEAQAKKEMFANAAKTGDFNKIGLALLGTGDVQGGAALLGLGQKQNDAAADRELGARLLGRGPSTSGPLPGLGVQAPAIGNPGEVENRFIGGVKQAGLTNPIGLAAVAAYGKAESGYSPRNANRVWNDPSESGQPGQAGGIMSWRAERLQNLHRFAQSRGEQPGNISPETQAAYLASEDPQLIPRLNAARSPEEANQIMANAWRFAGFDRPGGENARRLAMTQAYAQRFGEQPQTSQAPAQGGPSPAGPDGVYGRAPTPQLQAFLNNPKVPEHLRGLIRQELARRSEGAPVQVAENEADVQRLEAQMPGYGGAQPQQPQGAPLQVAQAPVQPGTPQADVPAQGAAQAQGFVVPGTGEFIPADTIASNPRLRDLAIGMSQARTDAMRSTIKTAFDLELAAVKERQGAEGRYLDTQNKRLQNEKIQRELQGDGALPLSADERKQFGIPENQAAYKTRSGEIKFGPAGTTVRNEPPPPNGYRYVRDAQGNIERAEPIPGSKAAQEAEAAASKQQKAERIRGEIGTTVGNALDDIDRLMKASWLPTTGGPGSLASAIKGTAAHDISQALTTIGANISFQQLQQMREASPTGGALGAVSDTEQKMLQNSYAALSQSQSAEQFKTNLGRTRAVFERIVHGRTLNPQERKTGGPMTMERAKALRDEAANAIAGGADRTAVMKRLQEDYGISPGGL